MSRTRIIAVFFFFGFAVSAFSQSIVSLEAGLKNSVKYFEGRLPKGTKLAVLNLSSASPALAEYVIEEIIGHFVNSNSLTLVARDNAALQLIQQEMDFQFSGEVSDETVLSIGRKLGAQMVITGSINLTGDFFRLRIRAIDIESGIMRGDFPSNISKDRYLVSLYNTDANPVAPDQAQPPRGTPAPAQAPSQPGSGGGRIRLPGYLQN